MQKNLVVVVFFVIIKSWWSLGMLYKIYVTRGKEKRENSFKMWNHASEKYSNDESRKKNRFCLP